MTALIAALAGAARAQEPPINPPTPPYVPPPGAPATAPAPVISVPEPPPPSPFDALTVMALLHGFCPDRARGPGCSGGVWVGPRTTMLLGRTRAPITFTADLQA